MQPNEMNQHAYTYDPNGRRNGHISFAGDTLTLSAYGKTYRFTWHNYLGPTFVTKRDEVAKTVPGERSKWWRGFDLWIRQGKRTENGECLWHPGNPCQRCRGKGHYLDGDYRSRHTACSDCHSEGVIHVVPTKEYQAACKGELEIISV